MENRLRERRRRAGLTQQELSNRSELPRSTLSALENQRHEPSVGVAMRLAAALDCDVEQLFIGQETPIRWAWPPPTSQTPFVAARVSGRCLAYPVDQERTGTLTSDGIDPAEPLRVTARQRALRTLVVGGCDPAAGRLLPGLRNHNVRGLVVSRPTKRALKLLEEGKIHAAGIHTGTADGSGNQRLVRSTLGSKYVLIRVARWDIGVVSRRSLNRSSLSRLLRSRRWINRPPGSGGRRCLDELLRQENVSSRPEGYDREAFDHRSVVEVVNARAADAGISLAPCAQSRRLEFLPVKREAYDLCVPESFREDPRFEALSSVLNSTAHRRDLGAIPGYDSSTTGRVFNL